MVDTSWFESLVNLSQMVRRVRWLSDVFRSIESFIGCRQKLTFLTDNASKQRYQTENPFFHICLLFPPILFLLSFLCFIECFFVLFSCFLDPSYSESSIQKMVEMGEYNTIFCF
ncbi:hypothetical protein CAEBREN_12683 [Caenorhabditis brenneri]|uniref:Uncharacterized protein n=1 Tax=Caenorhabditis brenneri TaxID=135651 RepID=G0MHA7_CAEBE|nr:hypothetical protein CAEBREN_12683 [Caenorhabditis brenneri]